MMPTKPFTPDQERAITTLDHHMIVVAGPGSGKTLVLVERFLNILQRQTPAARPSFIDAIAAITFTKKAAREMKSRIRRAVKRLSQASLDESERNSWNALRRRIESAEITTIHGLCARILYSHPVEAQIDPAFSILDEFQTRWLQSDAADIAVQQLIQSGRAIAAPLVLGYGRRQGLKDALMDLYANIRSHGLALDAVEQITLHHLGSMEDFQSAVRPLEPLVEQLQNTGSLTENQKKQMQALRTAWEKNRSVVCRRPDMAQAPSFEKSLNSLDRLRAQGRLSPLVVGLRERLEQIRLCFYDACGAEPAALLLAALRTLNHHYTQAKESRQALDYEDLLWQVRRLLRSHPQLARQYSRRYRFLLVDEFQDTNSLQKDIIFDLALAEEGPANLFVVGDPKQSVYNFRGAEVEVFEQTARELAQRGAAVCQLKENFRSAPALIHFFNALFEHIMSASGNVDEETARRLGYVPYLESLPTRRSPEITQPVELLLALVEAGTAVDAREAEARALAARLHSLVTGQELCVSERRPDGEETRRAARYGDIAILFRAMSDIKIYEYALRRAGVPYIVVTGRGFYEREEIQDVVSLLTLLENRTDEIALTAALRSPLFGISDETLYWLRQTAEVGEPRLSSDPPPLLNRLLSFMAPAAADDRIHAPQKLLLQEAARILEQLFDGRHRLPLPALLEEILRLTDLRALQAMHPDANQRIANLDKLVELSRGFDAGGPHFLTDFVHYLERFTELESREAEADLQVAVDDELGAVQILTIHKAKGLEFPIVMLPDLQRDWRNYPRKIPMDRSLGLGVQVPSPSGLLHKTALYEKVLRHIRQREHFEAQRLFFVAITRARDYLILSGILKPGQKARSPAGASSYMEWLDHFLRLGERLHDLDREGGGMGPAIFHWEGMPIRLTLDPAPAPSDLTKEAGAAPLVARYPAILEGRFEAEEIPANPKVALEAETIVRRLAPLPAMALKGGPVPVTKLAMFARCPLQYYYEAYLGLGECDFSEGAFAGEGEAPLPKLAPALRGRVLHRFCHQYTGAGSVSQTLERALEKEGVLHSATRRRLIPELEPLALRYTTSEIAQRGERIRLGQEAGVAYGELDLYYRTANLWLRGRPDKVIVDAEGEATVIDFKTHSVGSSDLETLSQEYLLQLQAYSLMVLQALNHPVRCAQIYFLSGDARISFESAFLEPEPIIANLDRISRQWNEARRTLQFPARPEAARCSHCPSRSYCPFAMEFIEL